MKKSHITVSAFFAFAVLGLVFTGCQPLQPVSAAQASAKSIDVDDSTYQTSFLRRTADTESPSGHSVAVDCQDPSLDVPYQPYDWPDAAASLAIVQSGEASSVTIELTDAKPNTYYTVWLRLKGNDVDGVAFGGNPLTDGGATALAPTSALNELLAATGAGNGTDTHPNGFYSDENGNATFHAELDFPILGGAYPFQRFADFDATDARYPAENPRIYPVAIVGPEGPYTLRMVSHCTDGVGHGFQSGPREFWFDWTNE